MAAAVLAMLTGMRGRKLRPLLHLTPSAIFPGGAGSTEGFKANFNMRHYYL